ncbi:MAG TPA: NAD(P)/FAD-dependent oxidoreductase [Solirubrobacteraceae bacterium]|nr:NAD(P)/FAD-dependent oxidoreductase [Solirubrobacteraceae bacterium]
MAVDVVIAGGGHNGLVAAAYLARAGRSVLVLERRAEPGGAAVSERPFAGREARLSRYAYLVSLLPPRIARDLGVHVELRERHVAAYADGLIVDADAASARTRASFAAIGAERDHEAWLTFQATLAEPARRLFATVTEPLPTRAEARAMLGDAWSLLAERPLGKTLTERFDHPLVRGVLATDGLIGTFASLDDPGLAQNRCFLWHVVGGPWRVPVGGMGAITSALAAAAQSAGAEIRTRAEVQRIDGGEVTWTEQGAEHAVTARHVLANVAPAELARLRGAPSPRATAEGCQTKVNLLLDRLPRLRSGVAPEDAFAGTFRLHERDDELEAAYRQAADGDVPDRPPAELYCHSLTDPSIVDGGHTLTLFGLHTPASLFRDREDEVKALLADRYLQALDDQLAEPIRDCLARDANGEPCIEVKSPLDLERELRLPAGNIFHGELDWPWTEDSDRWGVATDDPRIVLCGAGARRGGGVSGVAGHNAAMHVLGR